MIKQGEDLYHYNITNRITQKTPINCVEGRILWQDWLFFDRFIQFFP